MSVLVTGAGLVGCQIAAQLVARGERVVLYDAAPQYSAIADIVPLDGVKVAPGDVLDLPHLLRTIRSEDIDRVAHTAGLLVAGVARNPYMGVRINVDGTATVLEAARLERLRRVVFASSGTIYISAYPSFSAPMPEDFRLDILGERPSMVYAATKLFCEWLGLSYLDAFAVDFVALRFDSIFGPWRGALGGRFSNLMKQLMLGALHRQPVAVDSALTWAGGDQFVYSKDAARSVVLALFADPARLPRRVYNVAMGRLYDFDDIIRLVRQRYPTADITVREVVTTGLGGAPIRHQAYDMTAAREELGFIPEYDMDRAIADYGEWLGRVASGA